MRRALASGAAAWPRAWPRPASRGCAGRSRGWRTSSAITSPCSVRRIWPVHRARRLRQDGLVARAAAAADRAAAAVEQAQRDAVLRARSGVEQLDQRDLGAVQLPVAGEEAAVLVAVAVAEHDVLLGAACARSAPRCRAARRTSRMIGSPRCAGRRWSRTAARRSGRSSRRRRACRASARISFCSSSTSSRSLTSSVCEMM